MIHAHDENRRSFFEHGWEPFAEVGNYLVYSVKGVSRFIYVYDENRRMVQKTELGADDTPKKMIKDTLQLRINMMRQEIRSLNIIWMRMAGK